MVGCAAPNCSNSSRHGGYKFHRFPTDKERRNKWLVNSRRKDWIPTTSNFLCNIHFEESQFEQNRADGKKKLKPNAVPTIFDVSNPPPRIAFERKSIYKRDVKNSFINTSLELASEDGVSVADTSQDKTPEVVIQELQKRIAFLENRNQKLEEQVTRTNETLSNFLTSEQIRRLGHSTKQPWSEDGIIKGLKLRFVLGKQGYSFLRKSGYPAPSYTTLNNHIRGFKIEFDIFYFVFPLLKTKVDVMSDFERDCVLMIDEMEISGNIEYDNQSKTFIGSVTMGSFSATGNHLTLVILRGVTTKWKQIVAAHITGPSTGGYETKALILKVIDLATEIGLNVCAVVSDMGSMNKRLWCALGISVTRSERKVSFQHNNMDICVFADVPHLVKNWRSALQSSDIVIPQDVADKEDLPSTVVSSKFITQLWDLELTKECGLRSLYHLTKSSINPNHFQKMNVGLALRYLSLKTSTALETAVALKLLPPAALTTAWFIRFLNEWFCLLMSRNVMKSITKKNCEKKVRFLEEFVNVIQETKIGSGAWKPLNTGSIMSTLSFIQLTKILFGRNYGFVMGSRFTQDALENIFAQIRKRVGANPSAAAVKKALKLISISQFMTPCDKTNYCSDSDKALLHFSDVKNFKDRMSVCTDLPSTSSTGCPEELNVLDHNNRLYIAGSAVNAVLKRRICDICIAFLLGNGEGIPKEYLKLTEFSDFGGLKYISKAAYDILTSAELLIQKHKKDLLSSAMSMQKIINIAHNLHREVPSCCDILEKLLTHYTKVRGFGLCRFLETKRKFPPMYGNKTQSKKQRRI